MGGYSAINIGAAKFAGLYTQRNPYAAVTQTDGINREITSSITDKRRPGSIVYNSATWAPVFSWYSWKYVQDGKTVVRVLVDSSDGAIYDGTGPTGQTRMYTKSSTSTHTRFMAVNTELFFDEGNQQKKIVQSGLTWKPFTLYDGPDTSDQPLGDYIIDTNGNIQQAVGAVTLGITNVAIAGNVLTLTFDQSQLQNPEGPPSGAGGSGGTLGTAPWYGKMSALNALGLETNASPESALVQSVGPNASVTWTWAPVSGAVSYRIYVGSAPGGEDRYFATTTTAFTQTTTAGTSGTPPTVNNATDDSLPSNLQFMVGANLALAGLTGATFLNGQTVVIQSVLPGGSDSNIITAAFTHADYAAAGDTGTATTGNGITGVTQPVWATQQGAVTQDGGAQWINRGSQLQGWGIATPTQAPSVLQQKGGNFPAWVPNTYYTTSGLIVDSNSNIQKVTQYGTTGSTEPTWATTPVGATTVDGGVVWTLQGPAAWQASTVYAVGQYVQAVDTSGNPAFFVVTAGGTSGASSPAWGSAYQAKTTDGGVVWQNIGISQTWQQVTSAELTNGWSVIPLTKGALILNAGVDAANGSPVPLPPGYSNANMLAFTTAGSGNAGDQLRGISSSSVSGGVFGTAWMLRSGTTVPVPSNWMAVAWSDDADVTITTAGAFTQVAFTTVAGDEMVFTYGQQDDGTIPTPSGFTASNFVGIVGMATVEPTGDGMYGVSLASYDNTGAVLTEYNDNSGNAFTGKGNIAGFFWKTGGGVTSTAVTGGVQVFIPLPGAGQLAMIGQVLNSGDAIAVPAGFTSSTLSATVAMSTYVDGGSTNVCHGWNMTLAGNTYASELFDAGGNYTTAKGNIFGIVILAGTTAISPTTEINDSNGNLQTLQQSGHSGATAPTWQTNVGAITPDGNADWLNVGVGTAGATEPTNYVYAYQNIITKHFGTSSKASVSVQRGVGYGVLVGGLYSQDPQVGAVGIFRPAQGETLPLLVDTIPNNPAGGSWSFFDNVPDTSLNFAISAPIDDENDPPPARMTAPVYYLKRPWGILDNQVVWGGGPDTVTGSGLEAFPPLNRWPFQATPIRLWPINVQDGGLLIFTDGGIYIMLGAGTSTDPFHAAPYYDKVNLLNYDALSSFATNLFLMEATGAVSMISPQFPFNPNSGYVEVGFPIGDQFQRVTTGDIDQPLYNSATTYVSWNIETPTEVAMYVADGAVGWFRMTKNPPSQGDGVTWHPRAAIEGGTSAVQAIETTQGKRQLLIGPAAGTTGPILCRDGSGIFWDDDGAPYPAWDVKATFLLAATGALAEVAQISAKSEPVGKRPAIAVLLGELAVDPSEGRNWNELNITSNEPPDARKSISTYSDRYSLLQNGESALTDTLQVKFDYGEQAEPDELLDWGVYEAKASERTLQIP